MDDREAVAETFGEDVQRLTLKLIEATKDEPKSVVAFALAFLIYGEQGRVPMREHFAEAQLVWCQFEEKLKSAEEEAPKAKA